MTPGVRGEAPMADDFARWAEDLDRQLRETFGRFSQLIHEQAVDPADRRPPAADPLDALRQLKQMQFEGLISEQDYEEKKREILARL